MGVGQTTLGVRGLDCSAIQLFQLRLSPEQSGKVEYERERLTLIEIAVYLAWVLPAF
jgi:hypothetical protein